MAKSKFKFAAAIAILLLINPHSFARLTGNWSYSDLLEKSDLVVIARPLSTVDTTETNSLPDLNPEYRFIGLSTRFEVESVLKGEKIETLVLHHYRIADTNQLMNGGPSLILFDSNQPSSFLLYLLKEKDGRYAPVAGQTDAGRQSAFKLESSEHFNRVDDTPFILREMRRAILPVLNTYLNEGRAAFLKAAPPFHNPKLERLPERIKMVELYEIKSVDSRALPSRFGAAWEGSIYARITPADSNSPPLTIQIGARGADISPRAPKPDVFLHNLGMEPFESRSLNTWMPAQTP